MITWHQLPGLLVSNPTLPGLVGSPNSCSDYCALGSIESIFIFLYVKSESFRRMGESWLCINIEGWLTTLCGWGSSRHICCGLFTCVARGLCYHAGAWMAHVPLSDTRQSECVMWVCDCAHHMLVAGWFNSTHTPPTIKTRFLDVSNRIWRESAGLLFINRLTFANQMESSWLRSQEKLLFALFEVCDKCP